MSSKCRISGEELIPVIDLGEQYMSDFVCKEDVYKKDKIRLAVGYSPTSKTLQLINSYPAEKLFRKYYYNSSTNEMMRREMFDIASSFDKYISIKDNDVILDIASNSGELLKCAQKFYWHKNIFPKLIGIDPSDVALNSDIYKSTFNVDLVDISLINEFFSANKYFTQNDRRAKVISCIAMFYDLESPHNFLRDIYECLEDNGLFVMQLSYTPLMLRQNEFSNICFEHLFYYSYFNLLPILEQRGFKVIDAHIDDINGGSIRLYIQKQICNKNKLSGHNKIVCETRRDSIESFELRYNYDEIDKYFEFVKNIDALRDNTIKLLLDIKNDNKTIIGYGAATKFNTMLQYYKLNSDIISCIAERDPRKHGKYTVGTGIPIISEEEMRKMKPDYLFISIWQFIDGILEREKKLLESGTKFIIPLPNLEIIAI